ncbi:MAG: serine/threonine protein kinase [Thermodesulfovibrionales bacterium]
MTQKLLELLRLLSIDGKDGEFDLSVDELLSTVDYEPADLGDIEEELKSIERTNRLSGNELDILKALLVYILMRDGSYEQEEVFSVIFGNGKRITWH